MFCFGKVEVQMKTTTDHGPLLSQSDPTIRNNKCSNYDYCYYGNVGNINVFINDSLITSLCGRYEKFQQKIQN